jgi:hypothetical protein
MTNSVINKIKSGALVTFMSLTLVTTSCHAQFRSNTFSSSRSTYSGSTVTISNPVVIRAGVVTPGVRYGSNTNSVIIRNNNQNFNRFGR